MLKNLSIDSLMFSDDFLLDESKPFGIHANPDLASSLAAYGYIPSKYTYITVRRHKNGFYKVVDGNKRLSCMTDLDDLNGSPLSLSKIDVMVVD